MLEALLVERGARVDFEPHEPPEPSFDGRVDLRELTSFTIDPDTAKDFDDALSFRREPDGIRAWVHIADVSYFVPAGTPLDLGAAARALSTYVPGLVAPMLPHELADDLCSLRPHRDRLTVTVEIPPRGEPSVLPVGDPSRARLTYGEAQRREAEPEIVEQLTKTAGQRAWRAADLSPASEPVPWVSCGPLRVVKTLAKTDSENDSENNRELPQTAAWGRRETQCGRGARRRGRRDGVRLCQRDRRPARAA